MAGVYLRWDIEGKRELSRRLEGMASHIKDMTTPFRKSADMLVGVYSKDVFDTQGAVFGRKWQRLSPYTVAQKARAGYGDKPILVRTGALQRGFRRIVASDQAVVYNDMEYFKYHQSNRPRHRIPRRILMRLDENLKERVVKIFQRYLHEQLMA